MAASSKPTGVHYALVICVLIIIVLGVFTLLAYKGQGSISELKRLADDAVAKQKQSDEQVRKMDAELQRLKELTGWKLETVDDGTNGPQTVVGAILLELKNFGRGLNDGTYTALIAKLDAAIKNAETERNTLKDQLAAAEAKFRDDISGLNGQLDEQKKAREKADKEKVDADNIHKEEVSKKEADILELQKEYKAVQTEYDTYKDDTQKKLKDFEQRIANLLNINKKIAAELDEKTRPSFEVPDGIIRWVDHGGKKVWIGLGEADGLKPRTTFSVYKKTNSGVGRGTTKGSVGGEDIKGAIEVTRILEPNLSEARILSEDLYSPIAMGDPIYSPLWSPGRGESFSIIGIMDLNGDGKDDRDLLKEAVATAGAVIDNEVDDKGELFINGKKPEEYKPRITEKTKFLVIGKIPEVADTADPEEIQTILKINGIRKDMEDSARERGVRIVSLSDFLSYIGYKSQRRLFVPGGESAYKLKSGSASAAVGETIGSRSSSGSTSGAYSGDKAQKPKNTNRAGVGGKVFSGSK